MFAVPGDVSGWPLRRFVFPERDRFPAASASTAPEKKRRLFEKSRQFATGETNRERSGPVDEENEASAN